MAPQPNSQRMGDVIGSLRSSLSHSVLRLAEQLQMRDWFQPIVALIVRPGALGVFEPKNDLPGPTAEKNEDTELRSEGDQRALAGDLYKRDGRWDTSSPDCEHAK